MIVNLSLRDVQESDLDTFWHNVASIRVLEKCGFTIIGEEESAPADGDHGAEYVTTLTQ